MKKYQIAFAGTFDVDNYGDLMFPVIFEKAMKQRGLEFELTLFSPTESEMTAFNNSRQVYSYKDFCNLHDQKEFDALVIGGGALIHYKDFEVILRGKNKPEIYHNVHSWFSLINLAVKNNIKILFNLPQIPFEIPNELQKLTRTVFDQVDYLSFRDSYSKIIAEKIYDDNKTIEIYPDTVSIVDELVNDNELEQRRKKLLRSNEKYMVLHFQYINGMPKNDFEGFKKIMESALNHELEVVLLPIGYTFNDEEILKNFNERVGNKCTTFKKKLDIADITAILAGCDYYVGSSFHGAVVSLAYGAKSFSANMSLKNQELFRSNGLENFLCNSFEDVDKVFNQVLDGEIEYAYPKEKIKKLVNRHFDKIEESIKNKKISRKDWIKLYNEDVLILPKLMQVIQERDENKEQINEKINKLENVSKKLEEANVDLDNYKQSNAFRVGKIITWLPHKIKKIIMNK